MNEEYSGERAKAAQGSGHGGKLPDILTVGLAVKACNTVGCSG